MRLRALVVVCLLLSFAVIGYAADAPAKTEPVAAAEAAKVTLSAKDMAATEALASLAKQSKQKILVESNVLGKVTLSLTDVPLESALAAVCKPGNLVWRKIYLDPKSDLLDKPDRLAATLRLISGMSFPDIVVAGASTNKVTMYCQQKEAVQATQTDVVKQLGMAPVYLVSNDASVAAKEAAKNKAVSKYVGMQKDQIDMFMKMTPEEREQALVDSLDMVSNIDPAYMSSVMQTMMNTNPENLRKMMAKQTEAMFSMSSEQRRAMIKLNMEMIKNIPPELNKVLQEDAMAVMQEMKDSQSAQPGQ